MVELALNPGHVDPRSSTGPTAAPNRLKDYYVLVSDQPFTGTLADQLGNPDVWAHHETAQAGSPTTIAMTAKGRYVRVWLAGTSPVELNMAEVEVFGRVGEG